MKKKFSRILGVGLTLVLLISLLLTGAPVSAISQPTVALSSATISANSVYTITFDVINALAVGDQIVVTFPTGTGITNITAAVDGDVTVGASSGVGVVAYAATNAASVTAAQVLTVTLPAGTAIGAGATVQLVIGTGTPIVNPAIVGSQSLTVGTQTAVPVAIEAAVASAAYATTAPAVATLPGVVRYYNSAGVQLGSFTGATALQQAVTATPASGTIQVDPGLYTENNVATAATGVAITSTGTAAETVLLGNFVIQHVSITVDGFTITSNGTNTTITAAGNLATISDNIFTKRGTATTTVAETLLTYSNAVASGSGTVTANTFDTTLGATVDNAITVAAGGLGLTISNNTFTVDGAAGAEDSAINMTAAAGTTTISGNSITGGSGIGVTVNGAGTTAVTGNAFSNLNSALNVTTGPVTVTGNTIDVVGLAVTTVPVFAGQAAIVVNSTTGVTIRDNTISNGPNEILEVTANSDLVYLMFNNLVDNVLGVDNNEAAANTLKATHNWWGVASGPAAGMNTPLSTTTGLINAEAYLGGEPTGGTFTNTVGQTSFNTRTTVGVDVAVDAALTAGDVIGVANYSTNPQGATDLPALSGGFYDVHVIEDGAALPITEVLIKFYNANITANTVLRVWGTIAGGWVPVVATSSGVNLYEGYAYATITATTTPSITGLAGTPFALVEAPLGALNAPAIVAPTGGERDIPLTPTFSWTQVPAADGYFFEFADNADFVFPLEQRKGDVGRLLVTSYAYVEDLDYSSAYYWRVKAVSGTDAAGNLAESAWSDGVFITMDEPEVALPPIEVTQLPAPEITLEVESPDVVIPDITVEVPDVVVPIPAETPITPAWIYVIIAVGAVLVIALIVLIVRTRRVA